MKLLRWNPDFGIAARYSSIYRFDNPSIVRAKQGPLLLTQDHDRDLTALEVLLVDHILVRRQQEVEASLFGSIEQISIS
jgi:hypothetical protein